MTPLIAHTDSLKCAPKAKILKLKQYEPSEETHWSNVVSIRTRREVKEKRMSLAGAVRCIQASNLSAHGGPVHLSSDGFSSSLLAYFVPLHQFISKAKMRLDDHVETTCPDEAVGTREREPKGGHHGRDADRCATRHTHAAMDQGGRRFGSECALGCARQDESA